MIPETLLSANPDMLFVFGLVAVAAVLFASGRVRLDVVALLVVVALALSGILTVREAFAGFGDPVVILVAALLVVGEMLARTGIAVSIGGWMTRTGGGSEVRIIVLLMTVAAGLGAFMSSTAVVAIFIPVVLDISRNTGIHAARLLMPLSFGALISGMLTLIATTPNLVVSAELENAGYGPLGFFSFLPIGAAVLATGVVYMVLAGRRLLKAPEQEAGRTAGRTARDLLEEFGVLGRGKRFRIGADSPLAGQTLEAAALGSEWTTRVLLHERSERFGPAIRVGPDPSTVLRPGDSVLVAASDAAANRLVADLKLERLPVTDRDRERWARDAGVATVLVHPDSRLIGRTLREYGFRSRYRAHVLAVRRDGELLEDYLDEPLQFGDALLVVADWSHIGQLQSASHDFVVLALPVEMDQVAPAHRRAPVAIAILVGMVLLAAFDVVPLVIAAVLAALAAVFTRCLTMEESYRAVPWSSLVLIAGLLPVADALQKTGGVDLLVGALVSGVGDAGPYALLTALFGITAALGLVLSNTATAVLMAPVAIRAAEALGVSPLAFAMTVAIAASAAFATPVSTPVVTLVVEPGRYRFLDFVRVGGLLLLLTWIVTVLVTPVFFPF